MTCIIDFRELHVQHRGSAGMDLVEKEIGAITLTDKPALEIIIREAFELTTKVNTEIVSFKITDHNHLQDYGTGSYNTSTGQIAWS